MRWLITAMVVALSASTTMACINDREVDVQEREFKSHYLAPRPADPSPSPEPSNLPLAAAGGGLILLAAGTVIAGRST
jgi:hypothetical protein